MVKKKKNKCRIVVSKINVFNLTFATSNNSQYNLRPCFSSQGKEDRRGRHCFIIRAFPFSKYLHNRPDSTLTHRHSNHRLGTTGLNQARIFQFQLPLRIFQPTFSSKYTFFFFFKKITTVVSTKANEISISRAYEITRRARKYQKRRPYTRVSTIPRIRANPTNNESLPFAS